MLFNRKDFRPAYQRLCVLGSVFPKKSVVALTATAPKKKKKLIVNALGMLDPITVESSPDRPNIYLSSSRRENVGDQKLDGILLPLVEELKAKRQKFELTLIYGNLETISSCYAFFSRELGNNQYEPPDAPHLSENRMFTMYHAQYPEAERERIVKDLISGKSKLKILFVTVAFGLGIDLPDIRHVIHIGVPCSIEEYLQEAGRAGRDGFPATAHIYYNSSDISKARKHLSEEMRAYVQTTKCKREMILSYFGFQLPCLPIVHECCDFHRKSCDCDDCLQDIMEEIQLKESEKEGVTATTSSVTNTLSESEMNQLYEELQTFRLSLPGTGPSCVGSTSLVTGITLDLLKDITQNATAFCGVEDLEENLPLFSHSHALSIWEILRKYQK